jgi:hypothetical protein
MQARASGLAGSVTANVTSPAVSSRSTVPASPRRELVPLAVVQRGEQGGGQGLAVREPSELGPARPGLASVRRGVDPVITAAGTT